MMRLISVLFIVLLAGCTSTEQRKLIGKWQVADVESLSDQVGVETEGVDSGMTIHFRSSGKLVTTTKMGSIDSTKEGTWKIQGYYNSGENKLTVECFLQSQAIVNEIEFVDDDVIEWVPPNLAGTKRKLRFNRLK